MAHLNQIYTVGLLEKITDELDKELARLAKVNGLACPQDRARHIANVAALAKATRDIKECSK